MPFLLDESCFLQCLVRAVLCNGADRLGGDVHCHVLLELLHIDTLLLEVRGTTNLAARIELRRSCAV